MTTTFISPDARSDASAEPLPRITVVTPSFNQGRYLEAAMRSVLDQRYPNLEYIVLDGGSSDDSPSIIRKYEDRLAFSRSARDGGQASAISDGFARATGDILAWLNSDDLLMPGSLFAVARAFQRHPKAGLVYGARLYIDGDGRVRGRYDPPTILARWYFGLGQWIPQECAFWRRTAYERAGGIDASFRFCLDYSLFVRLWRHARFRRIPCVLGAFREHPDSKTSTIAHVMVDENRRVRSAEGIPEFRWRPINRLLTRALYVQGRIEARCGNVRASDPPLA